MCDFKVGDKVVCVDDGPVAGGVKPDGIVKGVIYTVERVGPSPIRNQYNGQISVFLNEVINRGTASGLNIGYLPFRFRKVQRRDLTAWLATENTVEGPVRKRVRANHAVR